MLEIFRNIEYLPRTILVLMLYFLFMKKLSCLENMLNLLYYLNLLGRPAALVGVHNRIL